MGNHDTGPCLGCGLMAERWIWGSAFRRAPEAMLGINESPGRQSDAFELKVLLLFSEIFGALHSRFFIPVDSQGLSEGLWVAPIP